MVKQFRSFAFVVALAGLAALVACGGGSSSGGGGTTPPPPPVNGALTILPGSTSVPVGQAVQFTAYQGDTAQTPTWTATSGTISSSGLFTAPTTAGTATITAVSGKNGGTTTLQIVAAQPITVSPSALTIPAGGVQAFTASSTGVTWSVNNGVGNCLSPSPGAQGQCFGIIDANGNYQAPLAPPQGQTVTITASGAAGSGTATATILFSAASLTTNGGTGTYVVAFSGVDLTKGYPIDVAGVINTAGSATGATGSIVPGGELDINSLQYGITTAAQITGGSFQVGAVDGRTSLTITNNSSVSSVTSFTLQVALINSQHALLIDFDSFATGSGTLDSQNTQGFSTLSGNYSFSFSGVDSQLAKNFSNLVPVYAAGTFLANGNSIPVNPINAPTNVQDVIDNSLETPQVVNDQTLNGLFTDPDANGRGTMSMNSTVFTTINFAYYLIDATHMKIVETDAAQTFALSGDIYSAPKVPTPLTGAAAFTADGQTTKFGPYVIGGAFEFGSNTTSSSTSILEGQLDLNTGVSNVIGETIQSGSLSNDTGTGFVPSRYLLSLSTQNSSQTLTFSVYMTATNPPTALIIETDTFTAGSAGTMYQQTAGGSNTGSYAMNLTGVGSSKSTGLFQQDMSGQIGLVANSETVTGTIDFNNSGTSTSAINSASANTVWFLPVETNGRGTAVWATQNGAVFRMAYYVVNGGTVLLLDTDSNRVATGMMVRQF
jgi:hypothetical protein